MSLGPRLDLRQSQSLVMTPQLQQAIKLLALSNLEIESFIGDALEQNPLLDTGDASEEPGAEPSAGGPSQPATSGDLVGREASENDVPTGADPSATDPAAINGDHETGEWSRQWDQAGGEFAPDIENRSNEAPSLAEHLLGQVGAEASDPQLALIAIHLIGLLDEAGYLDTPLRETAGDLGVTLGAAEQALSLVQSLDPTGVGARSLGECLALQAQEADRFDPCMERLIDNLDLVARGDLTRVKRICDVDDEDLADMLSELRNYDPKPGLRFGGGERTIVTPDIIITATQDNGWDIALNQATLPRLVVNRTYYLELRQGSADKASRAWLSEKLATANWLIKALDQRQKTILKVAAEIVKQQDGFLRHGVSALKPLTLRTVAEAIDMHESTVSRVTSNKYLHCERGTFELKYFFTSGVSSIDGEGAVSAEAVKAQIRSLVGAEDPDAILSDDKLVELLREKGFDLARRTVAKYREAIGIGSSVQRRRQKKLARVA